MSNTLVQLTRATVIVPFSLVLAFFVAGCGDDEPGSSQSDTATADTAGQDVGGRDRAPQVDATEDVVEETVDLDLVEEEVDPLPETEIDCTDEIDNDGDEALDCDDSDCDGICEICNDLLDNNADDLIDCGDPWCSDSEYCSELCNNEADDDADGAVDCDDDECAAVARCVEPTTTADTYTFSSQLSYFWQLQFPATASQCCFDFTGDDVNDNALLTLLSVVPDYDGPSQITATVNSGDLGLLIEWLDPPVALDADSIVEFNVFRGNPTAPPWSGVSSADPNTNTWRDGEGLFQIARDSFDSRGPGIRFRGGTIGEGSSTVSAGPASFQLTVPIPPLGVDLEATVNNTFIEMDLEIVTRDTGPDEVKTVQDDSGATTIAGGRLGGYILLDDMMSFFNKSAEACGCSKPSTEAFPLITYGEAISPRAAYVAECIWSPLGTNDFGYSCTDDDSPFCSTLDTLCGVLPGMSFFADVDSNGNGIKDAFSAGLRFDLARAQLDDPAVAP